MFHHILNLYKKNLQRKTFVSEKIWKGPGTIFSLHLLIIKRVEHGVHSFNMVYTLCTRCTLFVKGGGQLWARSPCRTLISAIKPPFFSVKMRIFISKTSFGGKNKERFTSYACHPCAGAMLIFSVSFQF